MDSALSLRLNAGENQRGRRAAQNTGVGKTMNVAVTSDALTAQPQPAQAPSAPAAPAAPAAAASPAAQSAPATPPEKPPYPPAAPAPTQEGPLGIRYDFNFGCRDVLPKGEHP